MVERLSVFKELLNASIFLALITSLLYITGTAYLDAYLTEWGIESGLIRNNTQEILVQGSIVWLVGGVYLIIPAILLLVWIFLPIHLASEISKFPFVRRILLKIYDAIKPTEHEELEVPYILKLMNSWWLQFSVLLTFLSIFIFLFYWLVTFSNSQGKEKATKEYQEFSSNTISTQGLFSRKKQLTINGTENEGYILANSDSLAVVYLTASTTKPEQVIVIPLSSISQIKATNKVGK